MATLAWRRDGDQWVAKGSLGEYRITPWTTRYGTCFALTAQIGSRKKAIEEGYDLKTVQRIATHYDSYRAA